MDADHDARHTRRLAEEYLAAGAKGEDCGQLAVALASAVLATPEVRIAFEVLAGGPFAHARATELAVRLLRSAAAEEVLSAGNSSGPKVGQG